MELHQARKNTDKIVKSLRLAKNRKASDVFSCLSSELPSSLTKIKKREVPEKRTFLNISAAPQIQKPKAQRIQSVYFKRFRDLGWTTERVVKLTKQDRRKLKGTFADQYEWQMFCQYCGVCKNGFKKSRAAERRRAKQSGRGRKRNRATTYENYIKSDQWLQRKNLYYQAHPRRCAVCNTAKFIHLHHMDYSHVGNEPDQHLIPLCNPHHEQFHKEFGTKRHMIVETELFIERNRVSPPMS